MVYFSLPRLFARRLEDTFTIDYGPYTIDSSLYYSAP